jgi:hypothetical protein
MRPDELLRGTSPVRIADAAVFEKYFSRYPQEICEYTFAQMFLWGESREHRWTECEDHLCVGFRKRGEEQLWYSPIGPDPAGMIQKLSPAEGFSYLYVPDDVAQKLQGKFPVTETPERFDYVYDVQALRSLEGKHYGEKRNFINRARKVNPEIVPMNASLTQECIELLHRWNASQPRDGESSLLDEISALQLSMDNWDALHLFGIGVRVNGQLEGFSFGVEQNATMFVEYFEKATTVAAGLYPLLVHELAKALPAQYTALNLEEDLGLPGLRTAKQRWNPARMVRKYSL